MTDTDFIVNTPQRQVDLAEMQRAWKANRGFTMPSTGVAYTRCRRFYTSEIDDEAFILWGASCQTCGSKYRFVRSADGVFFVSQFPTLCDSCACDAEMSPATAADLTSKTDTNPARAALETMLMASVGGVPLQELMDAGAALMPIPDGPDTRPQIVTGLLLELRGSLPIRVEGDRVFLDV